MTGACLLAATANANTISFETPISSTTSGGAVDAKAIFTTGANTLSITLMNLESNPKDVAECISALGFAITTGQTGFFWLWARSSYRGRSREHGRRPFGSSSPPTSR